MSSQSFLSRSLSFLASLSLSCSACHSQRGKVAVLVTFTNCQKQQKSQVCPRPRRVSFMPLVVVAATLMICTNGAHVASQAPLPLPLPLPCGINCCKALTCWPQLSWLIQLWLKPMPFYAVLTLYYCWTFVELLAYKWFALEMDIWRLYVCCWSSCDCDCSHWGDKRSIELRKHKINSTAIVFKVILEYLLA